MGQSLARLEGARKRNEEIAMTAKKSAGNKRKTKVAGKKKTAGVERHGGLSFSKPARKAPTTAPKAGDEYSTDPKGGRGR